MNIEREYTSELNAVRQYIIDAKAQYNKIVPRLSLTRGIKNNTTSMVLSVNPTSWNLEKVVFSS